MLRVRNFPLFPDHPLPNPYQVEALNPITKLKAGAENKSSFEHWLRNASKRSETADPNRLSGHDVASTCPNRVPILSGGQENDLHHRTRARITLLYFFRQYQALIRETVDLYMKLFRALENGASLSTIEPDLKIYAIKRTQISAALRQERRRHELAGRTLLDGELDALAGLRDVFITGAPDCFKEVFECLPMKRGSMLLVLQNGLSSLKIAEEKLDSLPLYPESVDHFLLSKRAATSIGDWRVFDRRA